jgi:hypothetical protein
VGTTEICNNIDDNCNGMTDEGDPGGGGACLTGKFGICAPGVAHCMSGAINCVQNAQPGTETCNGLDDDCDGATDNGTNLCPATNHVTSAACSGGGCGITACNPNFYDVNKSYADGCECMGVTASATCNAPTNLGTLSAGQSATTTAVLPAAMAAAWYTVSFGAASTSQKIGFTSNLDTQFVLDVYTACGTSAPCVGGGTATSVQSFQYNTTAGTSPTCTATAKPSMLYVKVSRVLGLPVTCDPFTLSLAAN